MRNYLIITFSILLLLSCTKDNEFDNSLKTKIDFVENLSESTKIAESEFGKRYEDALPKGGKIYDLKIGEFLYIYTYQKIGGVETDPNKTLGPDGKAAKFGFKINGVTYEFLHGDEIFLHKKSSTEYVVDYLRKRGDPWLPGE